MGAFMAAFMAEPILLDTSRVHRGEEDRVRPLTCTIREYIYYYHTLLPT